ncbi:MAG: hypothetical protein RMZ41_016590 [Nostoc sp. DedVER02]|nr:MULTISPECIES: hypothetical protein [unclassified Nostoc]MDZ7984382.1 hypothetical protein [Nostoc sp. DedVER02]MDZ8115071.1 hypothetical protein [Nostoc sp. DedVER01b]
MREIILPIDSTINANRLNEGDARSQSLSEARAAIQDAIAQW